MRTHIPSPSLLEQLEARQLLTTFIVDPTGQDLAARSGSTSEPFGTITYALTRATTYGDEVIVRPGVYRNEQAVFVADGITLRAQTDGTVYVKGSQELNSGWTLSDPTGGSNPVYKAAWTKYYGAWDARLTDSDPSNDNLPAENKARNQVFVNGQYVEEVPLASKLKPGSFWIDTKGTTSNADNELYLWLANGGTPGAGGNTVEVANTQNALLRSRGFDNLTVKGINFLHGANGNVKEEALVQAMEVSATDPEGRSYNFRFENCSVQWSARIGFRTTGHDNAIINSVFDHNGMNGFASSTSNNLLLSGGSIRYNNTHAGKSWGGAENVMKFTRSRYAIVEGLEVAYNNGNGLWMDWDNQNFTIRNNRIHHNSNEAVRIEVGGPGKIYNNVVYENESGIIVSLSLGIDVYNNTVYRTQNRGISVESPLDYDNGFRLYSAACRVFNNIIVDSGLTSKYKEHFGVDLVDHSAEYYWPHGDHVAPVPPVQSQSDYNLHVITASHPHRLTYSKYFAQGYKTLAEMQATGRELNSVWSDNPGFADPANGDFHIADTSPANNEGLFAAFASSDRAGLPRFWTNTDIGAYQVFPRALDDLEDGNRSRASGTKQLAWLQDTSTTLTVVDDAALGSKAIKSTPTSSGWSSFAGVMTNTPAITNVGDTVTFGFDFRFNAANVNNTQLRVGLYNNSGTNATTDHDSDFDDDIGYRFDLNQSGTVSGVREERNTNGSLGSGSDATDLAAVGSFASVPALGSSVHRFSMEIIRESATEVLIKSYLDGQLLATARDSSTLITSFNEVMLMSGSQNSNALYIDNVVVDVGRV